MISVALTTYNGERFIIDQLDSILNQTKVPDEVLISDDGSTDRTPQIIEEYIQIHNLTGSWRFRINPANKGYGKNFLDTAMDTSGELVFFCDQDDIWKKDKVEVMCNVMNNNQNINLLCSNHEVFYSDNDTRKWDERLIAKESQDKSITIFNLTPSTYHLGRAGCTMCIRKEFLESIMRYWMPGWHHDEFVWKMAIVSNSCAILNYVTMQRRMHENNTTAIRSRTREYRIIQLEGLAEQYNYVKAYSSKYALSNEERAIIEKNIRSIPLRLEVVKNHNIFCWLILCMEYRDCYPRKTGLYLDGWLSIFKEYKGIDKWSHNSIN